MQDNKNTSNLFETLNLLCCPLFWLCTVTTVTKSIGEMKTDFFPLQEDFFWSTTKVERFFAAFFGMSLQDIPEKEVPTNQTRHSGWTCNVLQLHQKYFKKFWAALLAKTNQFQGASEICPVMQFRPCYSSLEKPSLDNSWAKGVRKWIRFANFFRTIPDFDWAQHFSEMAALWKYGKRTAFKKARHKIKIPDIIQNLGILELPFRRNWSSKLVGISQKKNPLESLELSQK